MATFFLPGHSRNLAVPRPLVHPSSTNEPGASPAIPARTMLSRPTVALDTEHLDIFFDRYDEYANSKLDDASLLHILSEHDNPEHMVNKYHQHESFEDFLEKLKARFPAIELHYYQSNVEGEIINKLHYISQ